MIYTSDSQFPRSAFLACLSLLTHLIQIISSLEVRSVHELCSDWHAPYTVSIAPYSLSRGNRCSLLYFGTFIHGLRCATSSSTDECDIIYLWYIQFAFTSRTFICTLNGIRLLRTGIMAEYPVMSTSQGTYVRIEQTSVVIRVTYEMCRAGGGHEEWNWEPLIYTQRVFRLCLPGCS